jgi:hypothetical protein
LNKDGATNMLDYYYWRQNYGSTLQVNADAGGNGVVDAGDYVLLRKDLSQQNTAIINGSTLAPVSEPGAIVLAVGAIMFGLIDVRSTCAPQP